MSNFYWRLRYWFYRVSGIVRRALWLDSKEYQTLGEIMSKLEANPEMREHLERARKSLGFKRRIW